MLDIYKPVKLLPNVTTSPQSHTETDLASLTISYEAFLEKKSKISPPIGSLGGHLGFLITLEITTLAWEPFSLYHPISNHPKIKLLTTFRQTLVQ